MIVHITHRNLGVDEKPTALDRVVSSSDKTSTCSNSSANTWPYAVMVMFYLLYLASYSKGSQHIEKHVDNGKYGRNAGCNPDKQHNNECADERYQGGHQRG
jgi:hypothetical protein